MSKCSGSTYVCFMLVLLCIGLWVIPLWLADWRYIFIKSAD